MSSVSGLLGPFNDVESIFMSSIRGWKDQNQDQNEINQSYEGNIFNCSKNKIESFLGHEN